MAINIASAWETEPPKSDFVLPGFLAGTVGALFATGATGKSFLALEAALGVACSVAQAMAIKYITAVVCAVQNGQTYCPTPPTTGG